MEIKLAEVTRDRAPSGAQYRIAFGEQQATITEVGAAVREYRAGDRDVFQPYPEDEVSWAFHGSVLVPWPNRVAGATYEFDGELHRLPVTEPDRGNALHGLGAWAPWSLLAHEAHRVELQLRLLPSPGFPFHVDTTVEYTLGNDGLRVRATSTNPGSRACPYAIGFHPYAAAAPGTTLDDCTLQLDASRHLVADERLIPIGEDHVADGPYDFRTPRALSGRNLDDGFSDAIVGLDGRSWVRLRGGDGRTVAVWADASVRYWQVYTGDFLPAGFARRSLAIEPMTAAPNAFRSGDGLLRLEPRASVTTTWGATLL
jgi:aldose 1-epimerase